MVKRCKMNGDVIVLPAVRVLVANLVRRCTEDLLLLTEGDKMLEGCDCPAKYFIYLFIYFFGCCDELSAFQSH